MIDRSFKLQLLQKELFLHKLLMCFTGTSLLPAVLQSVLVSFSPPERIPVSFVALKQHLCC